MNTYDIRNMSSDQRYSLIQKLINAEVDDRVAEDFESSMFENEEGYRDELISQFCDFLKKDLQSDNA